MSFDHTNIRAMDGQSRRLYGRLWAAWAGLTTSLPAWAHAVAGSGLLHPLTGADHAVAMMAVGAWSAQMGGRAIWTVPSAFVLFMAVGGLLAACDRRYRISARDSAATRASPPPTPSRPQPAPAR